MKNQTEVFFAFQISRKIVFEVSFRRLGQNTYQELTTSAAQFNQPKTNYCRCGQAQNDLLKGAHKAMAFFKKWDLFHLRPLTEKKYSEMLLDIELLKAQYNFIESDRDIRFWDIKDLSMLKVKYK